MDEKKKAEKLAAAAPAITTKELAEINGHYRAYIFRCKKTREIWTTCCGRYETVSKSEYSDNLHAVMEADHSREPYIHKGISYSPDPMPCPFCGHDGFVKELGRTGKRDNLAEYRRFAVVRWYKNALWVSAYYSSKKYGTVNLTAKPELAIAKVYRFKPAEAMCAVSYYLFGGSGFYGIDRLDGRPEKLPLKFYEPFSYNSAEGSWYTIIGADEVNKSPFKYCQFEMFVSGYNSAMRFLAVCCIYPRQIEMLMKAGMVEAVKDLVEGRKWNTAAFNWDETDPFTSFGLDRNEMRDYMASSKSLEALAYYKQFRKAKIKCEITDVERAVEYAPYSKARTVMKFLKAFQIEPAKWSAYILREVTTENKYRKVNKNTPSQDMSQFWLDYLDGAKELGYDLTNPLVQMPRGLIEKHDQAVKAVVPILAARLAEQASIQEALRFKEASEKYAFISEQFLIRVPIDASDIADEGKALKHCVGGYADRHVSGKLTILFLRSTAEPDTPLVTIEMNGNTLVQIHGFNNDIDEGIQPREKYAEFLGQWLAWVKAGSKRDEEGKPLARKRRKPLRSELTVN